MSIHKSPANSKPQRSREQELLATILDKRREDFLYWGEESLAKCESPIERLLGWAMLGFITDYEDRSPAFSIQPSRDIDALRLDLIRCGWGGSPIQLCTQVQIGTWRADFLGFARGADVNNPMGLVIECDGHDFHEKTKEQAARDKVRDRYFASAGYHVLRFTGSEIWRDANACATQIFDAVKNYEDREIDRVWENHKRNSRGEAA